MSDTPLSSLVSERIPRLWALWAASRPSQIALILLVYALGSGMATVGSPLTAGGASAASGNPLYGAAASRILVGALALLPVSVTIHYLNEAVDVETDALTRRTPFSGGSGALAETGLPASFLWGATVTGIFVSLATLAGILTTDALPVHAVALLSVMLVVGIAYSLPPIALIRRGVGETVNAALGGLLLPVYGVAVLATPTIVTWLAAVPFSLVVGCNLLATHWPDRVADRKVGKRTLVVRWSPARIRRAYVGLAGTSMGVAAALWARDVFPAIVALAHVAPIPFLLWGWAVLTRQRSPLPSVLAMVVLALASSAAWWWVGIGL